MTELTQAVFELIKRTSTDIPEIVENHLRNACLNEKKNTPASQALSSILDNIQLARQKQVPVCQDTGTPTFNIQLPERKPQANIRQAIIEAVRRATEDQILRPNAVHSLSNQNTGNNIGLPDFPVLHFEESSSETVTIDLLLKGGGCENVGAQYSLPNESLHANRDLDGVRKVILHAVHSAQGKGCAPGFLGVCVGGDRSSGYAHAKKLLFSNYFEKNPDNTLADFEKKTLDETNQLGIGPMGFGGKSTVLGLRVQSIHRLPASYFVSIAYMCWAFRHRKLIFRNTNDYQII